MILISKKWLFLFSILFVLHSYGIPAGNGYPVGARSAAMGRTSVALQGFWSLQNNQAGMANLKYFGAGISYENSFMLDELSTKSLGIIAPTKFGVLGLSYQYNGFKLYNEQKIGLAYAQSFGPYLRIGLQLDYLQTTLGNNYGNKGNLTFELGVQSDLSESVTVGIWAFNPIRVKLADYDNEKLQAIYRFGMAWHVSNDFTATIEAEKNTAIKPVVIRLGMEYNIQDRFYLRAGTSTKSEIFSMGFGFQYKFFQFNISATMHESLGFSPQSSLQFKF